MPPEWYNCPLLVGRSNYGDTHDGFSLRIDHRTGDLEALLGKRQAAIQQHKND